MRLPDDDELYDIDQTYLGPPGRYIGVMRYKTIFAALVILPLSFVVVRRLGLPMTLMTAGLTFLFGLWLSMTIADQTSNERPITALMTSLWHDLTARRGPQTFELRADGEAYRKLASPTGLPARVARRAAHGQDAGPASPTRDR